MAITSVEQLLESIPDYAKDVRINLGNILTADGAPELTETQIAATALAVAYATRQGDVIAAIEAHAATLPPEYRQAAKASAAIMAMNNVYYRFVHTMHEQDAEFMRLPAKLRMTVIGNPGIAKLDFEIMSLAVSMINGCGMCMQTHTAEVMKNGLSRVAVQSVARIAAVIAAAAQARVIALETATPSVAQTAA